MKEHLLPIYRAVAEGRLTQAEALERIKALKLRSIQQAQDVLLATRDWYPRDPVPGDAGAQQPARILLWGIPQPAINALQARRRHCERIGPDGDDGARTIDAAYTQAMLQAFERLRALLADIGTATQARRILLVVADDEDAIVAAGFEAMCRTAMEEHPALAIHCVRVPVDLDAAEWSRVIDVEAGVAADPQLPRDSVVRHVRRDRLRREIAHWRVVERHVTEDADAPVAFREGGCYLITGGVGGIGLEFAREIIRQTRQARILLAGRSAPSAQADREIDALRSAGHRVDSFRLDVAQADDVDALIARLRAEGQALDGIVHCAGITRDGFIVRKTRDDFAAVLAPKVAGLVHLDRATRDQPLDFMLLCSSFAACWGIVGQVDYAAANAFMDAWATRRNRLVSTGGCSGRTLSVNWPLWQDGGMTIDAATRERLQDHTGMQPLATTTAMRAFHRGLALDLDRMLVMEGALPAMLALLEGRATTGSTSASPAATATATATLASDATATVSMSTDDDAFKARTLDYITRQFSQVLRIPLGKLRPEAPLEHYGLDSILAMKLVTHLEGIFGKLPKTLAFEYQTIAQLSEYFRTTHAATLAALLPQAHPASERPAIAQGDGDHARQAQAPAKPAAKTVPMPPRDIATRPAPVGKALQATLEATPAGRHAARPGDAFAIVGLSGRYPEARDLDTFWRNLSEGRDCIREVPPERWRSQDFYRETVDGQPLDEGAHCSRWGGFIAGADEFDARFFNITPRDAEQIDPQERLFLQHAWMAIEDAGYTRAGLQACRGGQVGVYAGVMYGEYNRSGSLASIANRVSYVLNLHGPSMTLDTMCSSSLTAIHLACQDLRAGRTDMAIAGGVNLSLHPGKYSMLSAGQFISTAGHCQSFGEGGDGYIPGEGVGVVVLKRLSEAERDGDAIHAVIRGSALNHGGKTNGYTVPNPQAQAAVVVEALKSSGVDAREVSYIEAHGTGTKLGDPIEIAALGKAFGAYTEATGFCLIGSAKSNIGHCESAAGVAGLTKVILQMRHRQIVPSLHSSTLNPNIDFGTTPFEVNQVLRRWEAPVIEGRAVPRIAGLSSFGAGGSNAHFVIEEHVGRERDAVAGAGGPVIVPLSARTFAQLRQRAEDLRAFVDARVDLDLGALAHTLQVGREAMDERLGLCVTSREDLVAKLDAFLAAGEPEEGALSDDVHYAQSRRHRDFIALFEADSDLRASVDQWFAGGKFARLLDVWTRGLDLDWHRLHGSHPQKRMHLPVYPFAQDRYWREEPQPATTMTMAGPSDVLHSLVHRNASKPGLQRYRSEFASGDPRLAGLRWQGMSTLPHALQLEAVRVALADAMPSQSRDAAWQLRDVRFAAPTMFPGTVAVDIAVLPPGQGMRPSPSLAAFEIAIGAGVHDGDTLVVCQGVADRLVAPATARLDIPALLRQASALFADKRAVVAAERSIGIDVDAPYQTIESIHRTPQGLLLRFDAPAQTDTMFADCLLPPAALEAALRSAQWLAPVRDTTWLPSGFASLLLHVEPDAPRFALVRASAAAHEAGSFQVELTLCAEDGSVLLHVEGLDLRPASLTMVAPADPATTLPVIVEAEDNTVPSVAVERIFHGGGAIGKVASSSQPWTSSTDATIAKPHSVALAAPAAAATSLAPAPLDKPARSLGNALVGALADGTLPPRAMVVLVDQGQGVFALRMRPVDGRMDAVLADAITQALAHARELPTLRLLLVEGDDTGYPQGRDVTLEDATAEALLQAVTAFPAPTAAVLSGDTLGIGFRLACACDVAIAVDNGRYGFATPTGIDAGPGPSMPWLAARFGEPLAPWLAILDGPLDGSALQAAGWGCTMVPRDGLADAVVALRRSLADKSPSALRTLKAHLATEFASGVAAWAAANDANDAMVGDAAADAAAGVTSTRDAGAHDAVELQWPQAGQAHLRLKTGVASDDADLLRQLDRALRACGDAEVILLHSDFDAFLPEGAASQPGLLLDALATLSRLGIPVVAAVEQGACDAGLLLALACDAAVCNEHGRYAGLVLSRYRDHLDFVDALLLRRLGEPGREWLLSGASLDGDALRRRLPLLPVCPGDEVVARAVSLADRLRTLPDGRFARMPLPAIAIADTIAVADAFAIPAGDPDPTEPGELALASSVVRATLGADGVVLVRLEDRDARNMFSDALIAGLQEVFERIPRLHDAKVVVLTGYDTYFSSGGTQQGLKAIQEGKVRFTDLDVFQSALRCPLPVIAAMQGHGIGAGWTLGLFCDHVIFSEESRYVSPYMNFGFTPGAGATGILPGKLGYDLARESLFTGEELSGETLARRNPRLTVLPRAGVLDAALAFAQEVARQARADLVAWKVAAIADRVPAWQDLFAREVAMHEATLVGQTDALARIEQRFGPQAMAAGTTPSSAPAPGLSRSDRLQGVLPTIKRLLAEELRTGEAEIDPQTPFVDLGLDSISSVTWIRRINEHFGLAIEATQVYNHPNLQKLAGFIGERTSASASHAPPRDGVVQQGDTSHDTISSMPARASTAGSSRGATAPARVPVVSTTSSTRESNAPAPTKIDLGAVRRTLIGLLAQELRQASEDIDADTDFTELGLDSISGVTWIRAINQTYGIAIEATKVYTYPTIEAFARYLHRSLAEAPAMHAPEAAATDAAVEGAMNGGRFTTPRATAPGVPTGRLAYDWPPLSSWRTEAAAATMSATPATVGAMTLAHPAEIAVIGMAGRFPMAPDLDAFWDNLASGRNCISEIPESRWDTRAYYVEGQPGLGQSNSRWMGVLEGHDRFDPLFFGLSPIEAESMDPQQRLFLQCCWHGMEDAGYTPERLSGSRCGVFVGCAYSDYNLLSREQQINALGFTGGATSILAARISYFMNLQGPCLSIDTACSSSLVAMAAACDSLVTGASDTAFAGGVYVMANADMFLKTAHTGMLSPDGRCYTFDQRANGFVPGEGVGVIMLKRLADAERDGDNILGVLRGWGVNQDGRTNGITAPNAESQQRLITDVYRRFGIDAEQIQLIEAHGTGTKLGDPIEIDGLKSAFRPATDRTGYCAIGSVKTNIGHCLTAAGVSGMIKLLLSLKHRQLPPSINFETPNEHLDLGDSPFFVNRRLLDWTVPKGMPRQAAISSFGFSGTNAHLVLAEYVPPTGASGAPPATLVHPDTSVIIALSARSPERLRQRAIDLREAVLARPGLDLAALACTLQLHREAMDERLCFVARHAEEIVANLGAWIDGHAATTAGIYAGNVRQGRESVHLLSEDPGMAALVVDKCIADGRYAKLCGLWVRGLALDWRRLYGPHKPAMLALPKYPFADDAYWIVPDGAVSAQAVPARGDRPRSLHPLLHEKLADLRELGFRRSSGGEAADDDVGRTTLMHLPTYAFARVHCWIPSKEDVRAVSGPGTAMGASAGTQAGRVLQNMDSIAALFAELEQERLTAEEVTARVRQLA